MAGIEGTLGFLGFGNMGRAIAAGLADTGAVEPSRIVVYDIDPARTSEARGLGFHDAPSPAALAATVDTLVLAVKPQLMEEALASLRQGFMPRTLVITIAAGVSIDYVRERLGGTARVVRVMPNTPALVRAGVAGLAGGLGCTEADMALALALFGAVGRTEQVPEALLDAVTAVSGSGPAYFFRLAECLAAAGTALGLPPEQAMRLAEGTLVGAGRLLAESGEPASVLRARVTSKGGTTEAALKRFDTDGLDRLVQDAVAAAAARSRELGR